MDTYNILALKFQLPSILKYFLMTCQEKALFLLLRSMLNIQQF